MKMGKWRRLVTIWLSLLVTMTVVSVFTSWVAADSPKTSTSVPQPNGTPPQGGHPLEYQGDPPSTPVGPSQTWTGADGKLQAAPQTVPAQGGVWTLTWTALYGLAWAAVRRKKQVQVPVYKTETYTEEVQTTRTVTRQVQEGFKMGPVKTLAGYKTEYEQQQTGWREWTENVVTGYRTWKEKVATGVRHWVEMVQQGTKTVMQKVQTGFRTIMERVLVRNETKTRQVQVGTRTVTRSVPVQKQVQEQYVSSYRQVWDPVKKRLVSQPVYGTRYSTVTVYEQQTVTEPVYRTETYTEPVYENRTHQEPVYTDVATQVPNMVPVEHTEPVYTEVEHKEPIVQEVQHKDPVYEQVAKQVPVYETHMGPVPLYRTETVEEPVAETRTLTRQVQVGVRTEEQEVVENVQQEVFQGWSPSWKFTPSGGMGTADLDSQINAKSEELRQARELLARLPKEDQAGYQAVTAGLEAALADLYSQKNGSEVSVKAPALPPAASKPAAPELQVVQPKPDGSAAGLAARLDALNQEIDAASRDLRDARATLVRLPQADRTAYETQVVKPLETKLNGLYEQRNALTPDSVRAVQEAKVAQFGALARQGEALSEEIQLDGSLSSIIAQAGQAGVAASEEVMKDYIAFQGALQDYWRYLLDPINVSQNVHDRAILTMRNISSKYGTAFPGQDEWGLHQQNKALLSGKFRDLVGKLWLDKANAKTPDPGEQRKLDLWRSWVSTDDRAWEQKIGDLNKKVIDLKKQRWSVLESVTGPVSDSAAASIRSQLDRISSDIAAQRRAGATLPDGQWLDWEKQEQQVVEAHYGHAWRELHALMDQSPDRETRQMGEIRNLLGLLRPYLADPDAVDQGLRLDAFKAAYAEYWEKLLACDDSARATLAEIQKHFPDIPLTSSAAAAVDREYLGLVRRAYAAALTTLENTDSEQNRELAAQKIEWWQRELAPYARQWDTEQLSLPVNANVSAAITQAVSEYLAISPTIPYTLGGGGNWMSANNYSTWVLEHRGAAPPGIDCSGYVLQLMKRVSQLLGWPDPEDTVRKNSGFLDEMLVANCPVVLPTDARPGDLIDYPGVHIMMVTSRSERSGEIVLGITDSSATGGCGPKTGTLVLPAGANSLADERVRIEGMPGYGSDHFKRYGGYQVYRPTYWLPQAGTASNHPNVTPVEQRVIQTTAPHESDGYGMVHGPVRRDDGQWDGSLLNMGLISFKWPDGAGVDLLESGLKDAAEELRRVWRSNVSVDEFIEHMQTDTESSRNWWTKNCLEDGQVIENSVARSISAWLQSQSMQQIQLDLVKKKFLTPAENVAQTLGMTSERGLAFLLDVAYQAPGWVTQQWFVDQVSDGMNSRPGYPGGLEAFRALSDADRVQWLYDHGPDWFRGYNNRRGTLLASGSSTLGWGISWK